MEKQLPATILVHGFLDSGAIWRSTMNILGATARGWITPDLPGMGKLWAADGPFTLHRYADEIVSLIRGQS
jgi:pimeloyl-ACP methyl ester carboxylesterase